ncbi:MAG: hypothetical protein Q4D33_00320, partial [Prevotellaceae bacterium]|nr:hypothetical protein [Prevotellaceae bacterium]
YFQRSRNQNSPQEIIFSMKTFVHPKMKFLSALTKLKLPTRNYFQRENFRASQNEISVSAHETKTSHKKLFSA